MKSLVVHCKDLLTDDVISRLLPLLSCAVALLNQWVDLDCLKGSYFKHCRMQMQCQQDVDRQIFITFWFPSPLFRLPSIIKSYGNQIKNAATVFRLRVYEILTLLQPKTYEGKKLDWTISCANDFCGYQKGYHYPLLIEWSWPWYKMYKKKVNTFVSCFEI